jgi:hypothetical protein
MKKCSECGDVYDDSWKVCLHCNAELLDESLVRGFSKPSEENPSPVFLRVLMTGTAVLGSVLVIGFLVFAVGGLVSQIFFTSPMYNSEAQERFLENFDQQSEAEISRVLKDYEKRVLVSPKDSGSRIFLEDLKNKIRQKNLNKH